MTPYDINNIPTELGTYALTIKQTDSLIKRHMIAKLQYNKLLHRNDFYHDDPAIKMPIAPRFIESYIKLDE